MISFNTLTIKNFLSMGNVTQNLTMNAHELVLVLGENLDLGGNDNRNGVGKSSIVNALSFALFGVPLTNIKKDNLVNATNQKQMEVSVNFTVGTQDYTIIRGRKPSKFKFLRNNIEDENIDDTQGENAHTQGEINRILGFSHDLFSHIIALNTYVEPFLSLRTADQRVIIEQLLGITKLSEKAEGLKLEFSTTKDEIKEEEFRITAAKEANKRIEQNIITLEGKSKTWEKTKAVKLDKLQSSILELLTVDIETEINLHNSKKEVEDLNAEHRSLTKELNGFEKEIVEVSRVKARLEKNLASYSDEICPKCNQTMDAETHKKLHEEDKLDHAEIIKKEGEKILKRDEVKTLANAVLSMIPKLPNTYYDTLNQAYNHKISLDTLGNSLDVEMQTVNLFTEQIELLKNDSLQVIDYTKINDLVILRDHQDFLLKLLTNKDSFIRKIIIDQNLSYLNHRLEHYLINIGLPHIVKFKSDLEVEINMYGKDFDFDSLSRGERTRLILSLSWAFRDVFENMNEKINLLFIDELVDNGLDTSGVESAVAILKKMGRDNHRNIYLISHRDELVGRVSNVLRVIKQGGFTSLSTETAV